MNKVFQAFGRLRIDLRHSRGFCIDSITGLSDVEKKLIQESKGVILAKASGTGIKIPLKFFKDHHHYLKFYPLFKDIPYNELKNNEAFLKECKRFTDSVDLWTKTLDKPEELRDSLVETGKVYIDGAFPKQYFLDFGDTCIEYLMPHMDTKPLEAWKKLMKFAMGTIASSLEK